MTTLALDRPITLTPVTRALVTGVLTLGLIGCMTPACAGLLDLSNPQTARSITTGKRRQEVPSDAIPAGLLLMGGCLAFDEMKKRL